MSFSPDAGDAALLAWANACLRTHSEEAAPTLEAVVDTSSLSIMCKKFHLGDPEQGARKQSAAQRRRRVAEALNSCRIGLVEPSMAELGGPAAARSITAAILLLAVEAPAKEEAIEFIVTLDQTQQAELAQIIQQLMEATGLEKEQQKQAAAAKAKVNNARRRFSDVQIAGNDPAELEPLQAEARELHHELERYNSGFMTQKQAHSSIASKVAEAKAHLCSEADRCVDLLQELDAKEAEHRSVSRDLINLKEEMKHEGSAAYNNSEALKELAGRLEEERRRYRTLAMRHIDLKAEVDQAQQSSAQVETSSWKRTAMMAKLSRLQEKVHCDRSRLAECRRTFEAEEDCSSSLREELEQAQEVLSQRQAALSSCEEMVANSEGVLHQAESELDSCTQELKAMSSEDVDSLQVEIEKKKQAFARAEQSTVDVIAQRAAIGKQIPEVSAALEDHRIAAERATSEAVAEGVAATTQLRRLHALNDEATTAAQGVADLATRRPRASLSLLGPVSITLADDAMRLQRLNDELQLCQVEVENAESKMRELGQQLAEASSEATACRQEEEVIAAASTKLEHVEVSSTPPANGDAMKHMLEMTDRVQAEEDSLQTLQAQAATFSEETEALQESLHLMTVAMAELAKNEEQMSFEAESETEVLAHAKGKLKEAETKAEAEAAHAEVAVAMGMTRRKGSDSPGDAAFATQASTFQKEAAEDALSVDALDLAEAPDQVTDTGGADFSAMVKRSRAPNPKRAAKDAAASKLQARQRGIMARSKMATLRSIRANGDDAPKDVSYERIKQPLAPAKREERERAAIKLQALERGVLARARVQRLKDSAFPTVAIKVAKASVKESISEHSGPIPVRHRQVMQGPNVEMLEEQIHLRQRELAFKENQASEAEAAHSREVALMASSLHRLGMRYGRLLGQCQALEALVPERVRRMREGNPT